MGFNSAFKGLMTERLEIAHQGGISWKCWSSILQLCVRNFGSNEIQSFKQNT